MKLTVHNLYDYYSPSICEKRLYYRFMGGKETPLGPFEEVIIKLGERHEKNHINSLGEYSDVSMFPSVQRGQKTVELIQKNTHIIYQGVLTAKYKINDSEVEIVGIPDIMIYEDSSYIIRDCKLARHADEKRHPEILYQLQVYGYLYEIITGKKPIRLEAVLGDSSIKDIPYDNGNSAKEILKKIYNIVNSTEIPYSPVGWSKCQDCRFKAICWDVAVKNNDAALVYGVDQHLARVFKNQGIITIGDLLSNYDEVTLSGLKRPWGKSLRKVGRGAKRILLQAKAMKQQKNILLEKIDLPENPNLVMFDIEGFPPHLDELEKIYLWGLQVYGEKQKPYKPALSAIESDGDRKGWEKFLSNCQSIFDEYDDIPFIHWHSYEKTKIQLYIERYGDNSGIAQRVLNNLIDLLPLTKKAIILAEPSYSLKVVEKLAGFKRSQDEYGGTWAMAKYIEAVETEDPNVREDIINEIMKYNEEDLAAMWAVFQWLKKQVCSDG
jgi:predicted RecB family nuclease